MKKNNKEKRTEVYSSSGLTDLVLSPPFYAVLALAAFLGLSSAYGFLDNPHKLKATVDSITHRIFLSDSRPVNHYLELLSDNSTLEGYVERFASNSVDDARYSIFTQTLSLDSIDNDALKENELTPISVDGIISDRQPVIGIPLKPHLREPTQVSSI